MPNKFVRIKNPDTGHEETVSEGFAKAYNLPIIDKDAVDANGRPLASKPHIELPKAEPKTNGDDAGSGTTPPADSPKVDDTKTKSGGSR